MERAVYCYGWLANRPNCHPTHSMKNMGMVDELEKAHGTVLAWSMMGSGAISLPFLERQIHGEVPPQLRFHGFINEKEFNEECLRRGILPFAVVYEAQGWEFPAVFNAEDTQVREINILRSKGDQGWYGLREFTRNEHWKVFGKRFEDYFPDGIRNSDGERVTDLWEECAARDYNGKAAHTGWVEVEGLTHTCHNTCRNNPVWRAYLKKIIEIQIDAGAVGIQLDESESPLCSLSFGGCFCKDCMKQFAEYLGAGRNAGSRPSELADVELKGFNYGRYLRERGIPWPSNALNVPLFDLYWDFQLHATNRHFAELLDYAKEYGRRRGKEIRVSGNMTNMHLMYLPVLDKLDFCITELRRTLFRRHNWYRLAVGYTRDKPVIVAESPYDGFMPKFVELLKKGKSFDLYKLFIMEAAMHGCSMAFPYGAWMGNRTFDSFSAPPVVGGQVQDFLYENDRLFQKRSGANVLVLYSFPSYNLRDWQSGFGETLRYADEDDLLTYEAVYDDRASRMPFFEITQLLCNLQVNFDVKVTGDGDMVADDLDVEQVAQYDAIIVPDCQVLTKGQTKVLEDHVRKGGRLFIFGRAAENVDGWLDSVTGSRTVFCVKDIRNPGESIRRFRTLFQPVYDEIWQAKSDNKDIHFQIARLEKSVVIHLVNYAYDKAADRVRPQEVTMDLKMGDVGEIRTCTIEGRPLQYELLRAPRGIARIRIHDLPVYGAVEICSAGEQEEPRG